MCAFTIMTHYHLLVDTPRLLPQRLVGLVFQIGSPSKCVTTSFLIKINFSCTSSGASLAPRNSNFAPKIENAERAKETLTTTITTETTTIIITTKKKKKMKKEENAPKSTTTKETHHPTMAIVAMLLLLLLLGRRIGSHLCCHFAGASSYM